MAISLEESRRFVLLFGGSGSGIVPPPDPGNIPALALRDESNEPLQAEDNTYLEAQSG